MTQPASIPGPSDEEPVFGEPWEARVFGIVVSLHEGGLFTWAEWAEALATRIKAARACGDPDLGDTYYHHWLGALEDLLAAKSVGLAADIARWRDAWRHAAGRTPHGGPIEIQPADFG